MPLLEADRALQSLGMAQKIQKIQSSQGLKESIAIKKRKAQKNVNQSKMCLPCGLAWRRSLQQSVQHGMVDREC